MAKKLVVEEPVSTDIGTYLGNKIYRQCRIRHDTPPRNGVWERVYNDSEANCQYIIRCGNGCGYEVTEQWHFDPKSGVKTFIRKKTPYTDKEYLLKGARIYPRDAKAAEIDDLFTREKEDRAKLARRGGATGVTRKPSAVAARRRTR